MHDDPPLGGAFERRNGRSRRRKLCARCISRIGKHQQRKSKIRLRSDVAIVHEARESVGINAQERKYEYERSYLAINELIVV